MKLEGDKQIKKIIQGNIPAPQTLQFMEKMNIKITQLEGKVETICQKMDKNSEEHRILFTRIDEFIEKCDEKYADKDEFRFWRNVVVSGILVAIFLGVITLFFRK